MERKKLTFAIAYGLDARGFTAATGAFFDEVKDYIHAAGFILRQDGIINEAVYSTGPIGRFTPADALFMIDYRSKKPS